MPVPRERQRRRRDSREGDRQDRDERELVARDEWRGEKPHEHTVEREYREDPAGACWVLAVLALYGVLVWFFSTPFVARYELALIAILAVPLARISAAPLALAWNRHR